jgi:hypothetical protein
VHQRPLPHLMDESLVLVAHLRDRLAHRRLRCEGPTSENSKTWERRSKRVKKTATECALAAPSPRGGQLSAVDFDQSEWQIMYPCFIEEGLIDPCNRANKKNV